MCATCLYPHLRDHATNNVQVWDEHICKKDASPEQVHEFLKENLASLNIAIMAELCSRVETS